MTYNANMYMPQGYQQPYQYQYAQPVNGLVSVTGIEGAKAYQMPPNSSMPLFDANSDVLYVKTTDAAGYPTIREFTFQPVEPQAPAADTSAWVPREEFDALVARVEAMSRPARTRTAKAVDDAE